jgi:aminopeptidase YwaD
MNYVPSGRSRRHPLTFAVMVLLALASMGAVVSLSACTIGTAATTSTAAQPATSATTGVAPGTTAAASTTSAPPTTTVPAAATTTASSATTVSTGSTGTTASSSTNTIAPFDSGQALAHIKKLSVDIGVRHAGTDGEKAAVDYCSSYLQGLGYTVSVVDVPLPNGLTSHNTVAVKPGVSPLSILVGAHIDSWGPAPGANDNASGVGTVLELARDLKDAELTPTLVFVLFGDEEMIDDNANHHHYGSRAYVAQMTAEQRSYLSGMISLDMVGYGDTFADRTMGKGPQEMRSLIEEYAAQSGVAIGYAKDTATAGSSDHEAFERAGFPAVWLEWQEDDTHHTAADTYEHLNRHKLQATGDFVLGFLRGLTFGDLQRLVQERRLR